MLSKTQTQGTQPSARKQSSNPRTRRWATSKWVRLPPAKKQFRGVLPRRWVIERTFSWFGQNRRLSKEHERVCETSEAMISAMMSRLLLRRLAHA